jgi:tetratricopeptide (TPR) repeat protein
LPASGARGRTPRYWAFLSYSHRDARQAEWLHRALETYRIPKALVGRVTAAGAAPESLTPIFRDRDELGAAKDLSSEIEAALAGARHLVVVCSPAAAASRWTDQEIATFKRLHPDRPVFAVIVAGEPFASGMPGREAEECFPPALRHRFDARGRMTKQRAEPIAADLRRQGDGRRLAKLKLVAGMLGLPLDELARREAGRRQQRLAWLAAASVAGMVVTSGLAVSAVIAGNEARAQRTQAEGLIEFMLTDLRKKLEPVGRLDALDSVGAKALDYYQHQDAGGLSGDALGQRARALQLIGEIASLRGDMPDAQRRFVEAAGATAELLRRDPDNTKRLFDHAQSVYWIGYTAWQRGDAKEAEQRFTEYRTLAEKMVRLEPNEPKWKTELGYAHNNLGTLLLDTGRPQEAAKVFQTALGLKQEALKAAPNDRQRIRAVGQSYAWLAQATQDAGDIRAAVAIRQSERDLYNGLLAVDARDADAQRNLMTNRIAVSRLLLWQGLVAPAAAEAREAVAVAERLHLLEPSNNLWAQYLIDSRLRLADTAIAGGLAGGQDQLGLALQTAGVAAARDPANSRVKRELWEAELMQAELLVDEHPTQAIALAAGPRSQMEGALKKSPHNRTVKWLLARSWLVECQASPVAQSSARGCRSVEDVLADLSPTNPEIAPLRLVALSRMHDPRAETVKRQLNQLGFRHPKYLRLLS